MTVERPNDAWNSGDPCERYVGRWSGLVAKEFLEHLDLPALRWLEVSGTRALTSAVLERCQPGGLCAIDPSWAVRGERSAEAPTA